MIEILIIASTLMLDHLVKLWSESYLIHFDGEMLDVWPGVFRLLYVQNKGAAFGILQDKRAFFLIITVVAVIAMIIFLIANRKKWPLLPRVAMALMISGALGNFIDRAIYGYVRDLFDFYFINFAVFNVADICITCSGVLLIIYFLFIDGKQDKIPQYEKGSKK